MNMGSHHSLKQCVFTYKNTLKYRLRNLKQHLEDTISRLVGNLSREDKPSSSSVHHKTMPPRREIPQEYIDHDHSPNHEQPLSPPKISGYQMKPKL